ncbi:helix-turn-helix domain-containing protein [Actinoplanes sp. CA-030573]|uniref:helix-turn-helix domain-containing protein n=1 Tax=Actinoplanes sp. CA-030573 TaxID=3239898 RepID=UPI003D90916E
MLEHRILLESPVARVAAVRCPGGRAWSAEEEVSGAAVVLIRRGVFVRRADGRATLADVTAGYLQRRAELQQIAHPAGGDLCTSVAVPDEMADRLAHRHGDRVPVSAAADLAHRRLLAAHPADRADLVADLIAALLPESLPAPGPHPPGTPAASGSLLAPSGMVAAVDEVRALLHTDPNLDLTALGRAVGWSPWHLSRTFRRVTGCTLNAYRRRLRVRAALDELPASLDLAALALRMGFADQAHMTRAVREETGHTPGALRQALGPRRCELR